MACCKQYDCAGERSNQRARGVESRSTRRCNVVEERACNDGPDDTHTEIHHGSDPGAVEEPVSEAANGKSEQDEDND